METPNSSSPYNTPPYGFQPQQPVPNSTAVLVLGIVSIPACSCFGIIGIICGIMALIYANAAQKMYDANPSLYTINSLGNVKAGKICAIIGLSLSSLHFIFTILWFIAYGFALSTMPWQEMMQHHGHTY